MNEQLEKTLAELVAIPSTSDNAEACNEIITYIERRLLPLGLHIERSAYTPNPWLLATTNGTKAPDILLAAHLDVVPGLPEQFTLQSDGEKLIGRGTYDMKFAAACYINLFETFSEQLRSKNIGMLFTTDEEIGGDCMPGLLEAGLRPGIVFIPDGGDNWQIEEKAKGFFGIELSTKGRWAHGSRPWEGDNAMHRLMDALSQLRQAYPSDDPMGSTLVVSAIHGGKAVNQVPDYAEGKIDFRSFDTEECSAFILRLTRLAEKYGLEFRIPQSGAPVVFNKEHPSAQSFVHALRDIIGKEVTYKPSFGGSDARYFAAYSIPSIICEPSGGGRHAPDEWILKDDLERYHNLLHHWLLNS